MTARLAQASHSSPVPLAARGLVASKVIATAFAEPADDALETQELPFSLRRGRQIFCDGDSADAYYKVIHGAVRACKVMPDGRRHVTNFFFKGDYFGFSAAPRFHFDAEAITDVTLLRCPRRDLGALLVSRPAVAQRLLASIDAELSAAQDQLLLLGRKTAPERVASFLLTVADKCRVDGRANEVELPMNRADVADYLGLTIETVSRVMCRFKSDGIIGLPTPSRVIFRRPDLLRELQGD